ncbi:MAG: hypothetical protein ISN29_05210 [Gammaproteobacteria bacterium AqS3]|nr:hypothetical protein [Gammaproteobacteria bacterium AqS3]
MLRVNDERVIRCHGAGLVQAILDHWRPERTDNRQATHSFVHLVTNWMLFMQQHQPERMQDGDELSDAIFELLIAYEAWFSGQGVVWRQYVDDSRKVLTQFDEINEMPSASISLSHSLGSTDNPPDTDPGRNSN